MYQAVRTRLAPQTVVDLCHEVPNIVGVKDATGDISEVAELMSLAKGTVDVYSGNDDQIVPVLSLGGKGVISVLSNILPKETHDMVASYLEGDVVKSCEMQLKYFDLVKALFCEVNPIPASYRNGRCKCKETGRGNEKSRRYQIISYD